MSFVIQGEITLDADGAIKGVKISKEQLDGLGDAAQGVEGKLNNAVKQTDRVGKTSQASSMQVGNLQAQFNDIGVMLAAGQNPFQLAIQQGTQVNQVLMQMGGGVGAVKALGTAFVSMINPLSLATLGIIAGGAALVQYFMKSRDAENGINDYSSALEAAKSILSEYFSMVEKRDGFGAAGFDEARTNIERTSDAYSDLIAIAKIEAFQSIIALNEQLSQSALNSSFALGEVGDTGNLLGIETQLQGNITAWKNNREQVRLFIDDMNALTDAGTLDEQYAAALRLREGFKANVDVQGEMTDEQIDFWRNLSQSIIQMELLGAATGEVAIDMQTVVQTSDEIAAGLRRIAAGQTTVNSGVNDYIKRSAAAFSATQILRAEIGDAAFEVLRIAGIDLSKPLDPAIIDAAVLAANLNVSYQEGVRAAAALDRIARFNSGSTVEMINAIKTSLGVATAQAVELARAMPGYSDGGVAGPDGAVLQSQNLLNPTPNLPPAVIVPEAPTGGTSRAGSRSAAATAAEREQQAVDDLILSLEEELELSRVTDPVMREMIGYRDQLKAATDAERSAVEDLIRTRIQEQEILERQQESWEFWGDAALTALNDVDGALNILLKSLQQGAFLGTGPLGALFGGVDASGAGGLLKDLVGAVLPAASASASAQSIAGPTSFAGSGRGRSTARSASAQDRPQINLQVYVQNPQGNREIDDMVNSGVSKALSTYDADILPSRVIEVSNNPERLG